MTRKSNFKTQTQLREGPGHTRLSVNAYPDSLYYPELLCKYCQQSMRKSQLHDRIWRQTDTASYAALFFLCSFFAFLTINMLQSGQ